MQALRTRAACAARLARPMIAPRASRSYASNTPSDTSADTPSENLLDTLGPDPNPEKHDSHHDSHDDHHHHDSHHHHAPEVEEGLGTSFYAFAAALPTAYLGYSISRPGPNGEPSSITQWLRSFDYFNDFQTRNILRTNAIEQAAHDKHLFLYAGKNTWVDLKTPELINSGPQRNVPAGHYVNVDHVTEHYRKQAVAEEERKVQRLLAKQQELAKGEAQQA